MMSFSIPVSLLRQYLFCPRIPFYHLMREIDPPKPFWVEIGVEQHEKRKKLVQKNGIGYLSDFRPHYEYEVALHSDQLGLHGKLDAIAFTEKGIFPIEFKLYAKNVEHGHVMQLVAYAMLAEYRYEQEVSTGLLVTGLHSKVVPVLITEEKRAGVMEIREKIYSDIAKGMIPPTAANRGKCAQCEYQAFCTDRDFD